MKQAARDELNEQLGALSKEPLLDREQVVRLRMVRLERQTGFLCQQVEAARQNYEESKDALADTCYELDRIGHHYENRLRDELEPVLEWEEV